MPELPEMENYRRLLMPLVLNKHITHIHIGREKSINVPIHYFSNHVNNHRIVEISRKAKHLIFTLQSGEHLLLHLMLGGWMYYGNETTKPNRTVQVEIGFGASSLYFIGLRLGYLHLLNKEQLHNHLNKLGPEPLDPHFTEQHFSDLISKKRGKLKTVLIDQKFISGVGNCYSDEICYDAFLLPTREIQSLNHEDIIRLYRSIKSVLLAAIKDGGYMENAFFEGDLLTGGFDEKCKVYDRGGLPCFRCGNVIVQSEVSSRKMFYCSYCQH